MANTKDFIVKNAVEVGGDTKVTVGDAATAGSYTVGYDISEASYSNKFGDTSSETNEISGIYIKPDGTKMYVSDIDTDKVYQYSLSTAWDASTASYDSKSVSTLSQHGYPNGIYFKSDGTKFYMIDSATSVYQYSLSTAWDVSTASYDSVSYNYDNDVNIGGRDIFFKSDGLRMYLLGTGNYDILSYTLSTAWDLSTASFDGTSACLDITNTVDANPTGLYISDDGYALFIIGSALDLVSKITLSTAWDVSTGDIGNRTNFSVSSEMTFPNGMTMGDNGAKLYALNSASGTSEGVYQYSTGIPVTTGSFDLSTGNYFTDTPSADVEYTFSNPADVQSFQLEVNYEVSTSGDLLFFAADAGNSSNYDDADGWTTIIDIANQTDPDTNFYLVRQTAATDGTYDISFATNNSNAFPSGGAFMCANGATYQGVSQGSGSVSFSSGLTVGESVLFLVESGDASNTTYTPPTGYTVLFESTGTQTTLTHTVVSYKIADATSDSPAAGNFSSGGSYRALVHVRNAGTAATANDIVAQVQKADAVTSTFTVDGGQVAYTYSQPTITWSSAIQWAGGTAPTSPALGEKDTYTFMTDDTGTSYIGFQSGDAFS